MRTIFYILIGLILLGVLEFMNIFGAGLFSSYKNIDEEASVSLDDIDEIRVNMSNERIHIYQNGTGNEIELHYYGKTKQNIEFIADRKGSMLLVEARDRYNLSFGRVQLSPEDLYLDVYLPQNYSESLNIDTTSGKLETDVLQLASFHLKISSGKLEAEGLQADDIHINTTSGKVEIKEIDAKDVNIEGSSSTFDISEFKAQHGHLETSSGNITLDESSGALDVRSTSGRISLRHHTGSLTAKTSSGNIEISYREFEEQDLSAETSSGKIAVELPASAEFSVKARSNSGKFRTDFPLSSSSDDDADVRGRVGTENNSIDLRTTSGNIDLMQK